MGITSTDVVNGNGRIEALREKQRAISAAIAAEHLRQQKQKARERAKLIEIIGNALTEQGEASPELKLMLQQVLGSAVTEARSREFLTAKGWL